MSMCRLDSEMAEQSARTSRKGQDVGRLGQDVRRVGQDA
jgi:hypothetical protein